MRSAFWLAALLCAFVTQLALAGTNAGFSVTLDPSEVRAPAIGDQIDIAIQIGGAVEAKHALVTARYDSSLVVFGGFTSGDLIDGLVAPPGIPEQVGGGLTEVQSGGTQLGGTPGAGVGLLGMLSFYVVGALSGSDGLISITEIQVNASATDADTLTFAEGEFGVGLVQVFANQLFNFEIRRDHDGATISWQSRWPGIDDSLRYRAVGDSTWTQLVGTLQQTVTTLDIAAVETLQAAGLEAESATIAQMDSVLGSSLSIEQALLYGQLDAALRNRTHVFALTGLTANT